MRTMFSSFFGITVLAACAAQAQDAAPQLPACGALASFTLPDVRIVSAAVQSEPVKSDLGNTLPLPPFCRVLGVATPTPRSQIGFEVWLPLKDWNGRYAQVGNGGLAGVFFHELMAQMLTRGYAVAATDDGHKGSPVDGTWAIGEPEKVRDYAERAVHLTNGIGRQVTARHYGTAPKRNYFFGCSAGGREGLIEAQRHPEDFHGIVVGAPAIEWSNLLAAFVWNAQALHASDATFIPPDRLPAIQAAAIASCDTQDGVKDGIVSNPACRFDPGVLACGRESSGESCLTTPQIDALKKIYDGLRDGAGRPIAPGYFPSGEAEVAAFGGGPRAYIFGEARGQSLNILFATGHFGGLVFERRDWDYRSFDFARDLPVARAKLGALMDASDPDLSAFAKSGGKLLHYHGLLDGSIPAQMSTSYYDAVVAKTGSRERTAGFYRLFLAPGVLHCGFGPGPHAFGNLGPPGPLDAEHDTLMALERWVEQGVAPARIVATRYRDDDPARGVLMTRPLCPYPQVARWDGRSPTGEAASFNCE